MYIYTVYIFIIVKNNLSTTKGQNIFFLKMLNITINICTNIILLSKL